MWTYIIRRSLYSVLIILGVMLLTFVLFRLAAGDPSATLLGKSPPPREVEDLRQALGADKPLFWGRWRKTEAFSSASFSAPRNWTGIKLDGEFRYENGALLLQGGSVLFSRNFEMPDSTLRAEILYRGSIDCGGEIFKSKTWSRAAFAVLPEKNFELRSGTEGAELKDVSFYRETANPWDSQLADSLREIVQFRAEFPFVSFFNFGNTLLTREPVKELLWRGIWPSLALMLPIFFGELLLGVALSLMAAAFKDSVIDRGIVLLSVAGMSVSYLVFIIFGQWYLGYSFNLFPVWGYGDMRHLALPILIGIISGLGGGVRFYRTVFINELNKEYLRTALAKGCSSLNIYGRHLLKNAALPILTRASTALPFLFTGSLLLETFFGIPGLGYASINALNNADIQTLKALVTLGAFLFVAINLLTDLAYAWADPRVRLDR